MAPVLETKFKAFTQKPIGQIVFVFVLFSVSQAMARTAFFYGFLQTFEKVNRLFFENIPSLLAHVPFHSSSILLSSLLHPFFLITLLIFYFPFYWKRRSINKNTFDYFSSTRLIVFVAAFALAWELTTYNYNFYLNNAFYFDRLVLVLLAFLLWRYPLITPLFIAFAYVYRSQFNYPVAGFELYDKRLLFDVLILFTVFMYGKLFISDLKIPFLFFVLCIVAANYFISAVGKILISPHGFEWLVYNSPADLFTNVHYRGWLASSKEGTIRAITNFLEQYGKIFQMMVFILEFLTLFLLRSRKFAIALLLSLFMMHLGIFIFGSMLFWKWMLMDLTLAFVLFKYEEKNVHELFSPSFFKVSLIIILISSFFFKPLKIGWHDTVVNQYFTYEVEDEAGNVYAFEKNEMNPYHQWFQFDNFLFLVNKPCLPISGFGYTSKYKLANKIKNIEPEEYPEVEKEFGKIHYDPIQKLKYENFIKTFFKNRNERLYRPFYPNFFAAPNHLYSQVTGNVYLDQVPVKLFRVTFNQVYTKEHKAIIIDKKVVDEIVIP